MVYIVLSIGAVSRIYEGRASRCFSADLLAERLGLDADLQEGMDDFGGY